MQSTNWYEHIFFKEKLTYLFNNELSPNNLYIDSIYFYDKIAVITFITKNIPKKHPKKWSQKPFNAISFRLTFSDLINCSVQGSFFNEVGNLNIKIKDGHKTTVFTGVNLYIEISSLNIMFGDFNPLKT